MFPPRIRTTSMRSYRNSHANRPKRSTFCLAFGLSLGCAGFVGAHASTNAGPSVFAQDSSRKGDAPSADAIAAIKKMVGVAVQEKDGELIAVDFRKCGDNWIDTYPRVLEIPSVQTISVSGPLATHERIVALGKLPNLKALRLEQAAITDETIAEVAKFPKIDDVNLDRCPVTDECLKSLGKSPNIKRIRAPRTKLSDKGLEYLKDTVQLELLDLSDCNQISDAGLAHLKGLTKLRNLSLWGPRITDDGMPNLAGMTNMVAISFQDCGVTDASFTHLSGMTKLKEFDIFRTRVGNDALAAIAGAKDMSKMKLRDCAITTKGLVEHIGKFPNVTVLDISETSIKDAAMVEIGKLPKLEDLNLWHTRVTDQGVGALVDCKLKKLNLDDTNVGDGAIESVAKISSLEFLHLGKTAVTDEGIQGLAKLTHLKDLILTNTGLSKKGVAELQAKLPKTNIKY